MSRCTTTLHYPLSVAGWVRWDWAHHALILGVAHEMAHADDDEFREVDEMEEELSHAESGETLQL